MKAFRVRGWADHFENNRTRDLKRMSWVPVPTKADGDGYLELVGHANGAAHFGCWTALVKVAARCEPRGSLLRSTGEPHTPETVARMARLPAELMAEAWERFLIIGWLETYDFPQEPAGPPREGAAEPREGAPSRARAERNGREGKDKGQPPQPPHGGQDVPQGAQEAGQGATAGGCTSLTREESPEGTSKEYSPSVRALDPDRDIPLAPAFRHMAAAAGVPLGIVAQVILDNGGHDLARWAAWLLVTWADVRDRFEQSGREPIAEPGAWFRVLCRSAGDPPEWAQLEAKARLADYRPKHLPVAVLDHLRDCLKSASWKTQCPRCRASYWTDEGHECASAVANG